MGHTSREVWVGLRQKCGTGWYTNYGTDAGVCVLLLVETVATEKGVSLSPSTVVPIQFRAYWFQVGRLPAGEPEPSSHGK